MGHNLAPCFVMTDVIPDEYNYLFDKRFFAVDDTIYARCRDDHWIKAKLDEMDALNVTAWDLHLLLHLVLFGGRQRALDKLRAYVRHHSRE